jgi:NAD(P)-dependent dehydrogenase (short-subunit alcohol dehydrogenase family)
MGERGTGRLAGKVAIVTGGAGAIGFACARAMAENGASVVIADINLPVAEERAEVTRMVGGVALAVEADAGDEGSLVELIGRTVSEFGGLDVLHNNALAARPPGEGASPRPAHYLHESDEGWFTSLLHGTVTSAMLGIKHAVPAMIERGGGSIINTASISGLIGEVMTPAYGAGKAGLIQLTRGAAAMYGRQGIRCNAICPGFIVSDKADRPFDDRLLAAWKRHTPMDRLGTPDDVGPLAVYLASDESSYVTGQHFVVDGGFTMHDPTWADRFDIEGG